MRICCVNRLQQVVGSHDAHLLRIDLFKAQKIWDFGEFVSNSCCREMGPQSLLFFFGAKALNNVCQRGWSSLFFMDIFTFTVKFTPLVVFKKRGRPASYKNKTSTTRDKSQRGRPAGSKSKTSTTRDKSHFEYVEGRKCEVYGQSGHNSRTCLQK
jgi:hypothetical protein